jgi:hypothetical protein
LCSLVGNTNNGNEENVTDTTENVNAGIENVTDTTENVNAGTENVNAGTENVTDTTENVNAGTENVNAGTENVNAGTENVTDTTENVTDTTENVNAGTENVNAGSVSTKIQCPDCKGLFCCRYFRIHEKICKGKDIRQCDTCKKKFNTRQGIYQHKKKVECVAPPPPPPSQNNNTHIHDATLTDVTLNNINNNNNIVINTFGKEELEYLKENNNLLQELLKHSKKNIYGFSDIVKEIHCNNERPENQTIIKPHEYGDAVYILGENNQWEFREFEDVRDTLIDSVNRFVELYEEKIAEKNVRFSDKKELNYIKQLCIKLLSIGGDVPIELLNALKITTTNVEDDSLDKDNIRKFDKSTMIKIHEFTQANFKKNNGTFVKND